MKGRVLNGQTSAHDRLADVVNQHVAETLRREALGERVIWDAALQVVGGPNGQPAAAVAIYLQIPSPLISQCLYDLSFIEAAQVNAASVAQVVTDAVGRLFAARAQVSALPAGN